MVLITWIYNLIIRNSLAEKQLVKVVQEFNDEMYKTYGAEVLTFLSWLGPKNDQGVVVYVYDASSIYF